MKARAFQKYYYTVDVYDYDETTNVASGTAAAPAICAGGDVDTGIFSPAANVWAVATNGTEKLS